MILDLSRIDFLDTFYDHLFNGDAEKIFNLKSVKVLKDTECGVYDSTNEEHYRMLKALEKRDILILEDDEYGEGTIFIPANTIGELVFDNDTIQFIIDGEEIELEKYYFEDGLWEISLTNLGERCYTDNIEDIFDNIKSIFVIDEFIKVAPKIFTVAFTGKEITEAIQSENDLSTEVYDESWIYEIEDLLIDQIREATKSANGGDIDGPDDFMYDLYKKLTVNPYSSSYEFKLSGDFQCCFYSEKKKIKASELIKLLSSQKFDKIVIKDVYEPSDTPGISFNGVYSDEHTTYISGSYSMTYKMSTK